VSVISLAAFHTLTVAGTLTALIVLYQLGQQVTPVGANEPGTRPIDRSQDNPNSVSRFGGQAGTQAPDPRTAPAQNRGSRAEDPLQDPPCRLRGSTRATAVRAGASFCALARPMAAL